MYESSASLHCKRDNVIRPGTKGSSLPVSLSPSSLSQVELEILTLIFSVSFSPDPLTPPFWCCMYSPLLKLLT